MIRGMVVGPENLIPWGAASKMARRHLRVNRRHYCDRLAADLSVIGEWIFDIYIPKKEPGQKTPIVVVPYPRKRFAWILDICPWLSRLSLYMLS